MAAPVQIISETRSPRYMIQLRGSDVGDNCLQGGEEHRPWEGPVAVDTMSDQSPRGVL